ncbi:keratin [Pyrus ussuriensis x Pyrus communis]|uniref:Keratin n=1 Tax=Pyrus ussuriensis x Pyrus communis TaxID=2448454 RepID=A0A5N5FBT9_9ROSA|nr:keratin [Pyrus ussuriensis x Pyrus communis]
MSDSVKIENLLGMLTIKLTDENFIKWNFQFTSVLRGYDLFDHFTGESVCPPKFVLTPEMGVTTEISVVYKAWIKTDMALLSLLIATLSDDAIEHVVALKDRYLSVSSASVNHLKAELYTLQKGGDTIDKYFLRLKGIKDQLQAAGEKISDNDLIIAALSGLPPDYDTIRMVILARDTSISFKEFRVQLIGAEKTIESRVQSLVQGMASMYVSTNSSTGSSDTSGSLCSNTSGSSSQGLSNSGYGSNGPGSSQNNGGYSSYHYNGPNGNHRGRSYQSNNFRPRNNGGYKPRFNNSRSDTSWQSWSGNTSNRYEQMPECQICSRKGHVAVTCLYRNDSRNGPSVQECQICGKRGHIALNCRHRSNYAYQGHQPPPSLSANYAYQGLSPQVEVPICSSASQFPSFPLNTPQAHPANLSGMNAHGDSWIIDTGASHHMSPDVNVLNQATPYEGNEKIVVGNGAGQGNMGSSIPRKDSFPYEEMLSLQKSGSSSSSIPVRPVVMYFPASQDSSQISANPDISPSVSSSSLANQHLSPASPSTGTPSSAGFVNKLYRFVERD